MPNAPRRRCLTPGCAALVPAGRCAAHAQAYDQRRGTAQARGYDSRWARISRAWLAQFPLCGMRADGRRHAEHSRCTQEGRRVAAQCTDHIRAMRLGGAPLDRANLQSLCRRCNTVKGIALEGGFGR